MRFILSPFFCLSFIISSAQITQLDFMGGVSYYTGEMNRFALPVQLKPSGSVGLKFFMNKRIVLKAGYSFIRITGKDEGAEFEWQQNRNLAFSNNIHEFTGGVELNFKDYLPDDMLDYPFTAYMFARLGFFHMNPKGTYNDNPIELQPLGTEGQGSENGTKQKYRLNQLVIPFGFGFRINMNEWSALNIEYGVRKTFTDFLDDISGYYVDPTVLAATNGQVASEVSDNSKQQISDSFGNGRATRGDPTTNDWYMQCCVGISFTLKGRDKCQNFGYKRYN